MSRNSLYLLAGGLGLAGIVMLMVGVALLPNIRTHISDNYRMYSRDADGTNYACDGSPAQTAARLAEFKQPDARATDRGSTYLRYDDDIVVVGPDTTLGAPCSIRVENTNARYRSGGFIFLGPGFTPGSPARGSGGSPGGPGSVK